MKRNLWLQVRTVAAIIAWIVVALLLLNRVIMSEWVLPTAIVLTLVAILLYFSPRIIKRKNDVQPEA